MTVSEAKTPHTGRGQPSRSTLEDRYAAAERLLPHRWRSLAFSGRVKPHWLGTHDEFWYSAERPDGKEFLFVKPASRSRAPLFDHAKLAHALTAAIGRRVDETSLPIDDIGVRGEALVIVIGAQEWVWNPRFETLIAIPDPSPDRGTEAVSPDGKLAVLVRDHNLVLRDRSTGSERHLTLDGVAENSYATQPDGGSLRFTLGPSGVDMPSAVLWSPDSRRLLTHRIDQAGVPWMYLVQSSPPGHGRPMTFVERYAQVGEECVPTASFVVIDVATAAAVWSRSQPVVVPFHSPITERRAWWAPDGREYYVLAGDRGDRSVELLAVDAMTGNARSLIRETSETQVQLHPLYGEPPNVRVLRTGELIWWSERSGQGHLYLRAADHRLRDLTRGDWLVRDLVCVNEEQRFAVFTASAREDGVDPYVRQLYRVGLDNRHVERLTDDELDHEVITSPTGDYLIDSASWIDVPDVTCIRNADGEVILPLEAGNPELLYRAGWRPPERIVLKAADGVTDLYGLLYKPGAIDPDTKYPILDDAYPAPHINHAPVRFCEHGLAEHAASFAALGFAVIVLDARGTPLRSKDFQEYCRGDHESEDLDDHVSAVQQLASTRSWIDIGRVGIYGHSAGGRAAARAMLRHPEFFTAAVSVAGSHDDGIGRSTWREKYLGFPDELDYERYSNLPYVERLKGHLLLIHGELDDGAPAAMTLRLADALMSADKDFEMLLVPNADHQMLAHQEHWFRRRWDFFVRHLLSVEPPSYHLEPVRPDIDALRGSIIG